MKYTIKEKATPGAIAPGDAFASRSEGMRTAYLCAYAGADTVCGRSLETGAAVGLRLKDAVRLRVIAPPVFEPDC